MNHTLSFTKCLFILFFLVSCASEAASLENSSWHQYDSKTRTETWTLTPEKQIEWVYDTSGNRIAWKDWTGITEYSYDIYKNIAKTTAPNGNNTLYKHDARGNLLKITYPSKEEIHYGYDPGGVLRTVTVRDQTIKYDYDYKRNLVVKKQLPNGISTEYRYDHARRIADIIHTNPKNVLIAHYHYEYDAMDNCKLARKTTSSGEKTTLYSYDGLYRLIEASSSDGFFEKYTYDRLGNRKSKETPAGTISYEYDEQNRLKQANDVTFEYDGSGNVKRKSSSKGKVEYTFNELGQLVHYEDKKCTVEFAYNGQGERLSKTVNGQRIDYAYEDIFPVFQLLEEKSSNTTRHYFYSHSCLGYVEEQKVYYYLEESLGNPVGMIVDEQGNVVEEFEYDAFGGSLNFSAASSIQYNGEQVDPETGLVFLRTRYYDPELGRFLSPDRVPGNLRNPQSLNLYVYVNNNPINFCDPMGTTPIRKQNEIHFFGWAKGEPVWKPGDSLPQEGMQYLISCARMGGFFLHDPTRADLLRPIKEMGGHGWFEFIDSQGKHISIGLHDSSQEGFVCNNDHIVYSHDLDTIRIAGVVTDEFAQLVQKVIKEEASKGYKILMNNCVHGVCEGLNLVNQEQPLKVLYPTYAEEGPLFDTRPIFSPSGLYSAIEKIIDLHRGLNDRIRTLPPGVSHIEPVSNLPAPQRGNFGGIALSKRAEMKINLQEIHGAVFDEGTQQLILLGKKSLQLPEMRLDDLAVAMQSIYGLKGHKSEDPGISIDPSPKGKDMAVNYFGATYGTEFGKTLFDGDFTLKMLLLGKYSCRVPGFASILNREHCHKSQMPKGTTLRMWIVPDKISLAQSEDGSAMVFETVRMRCFAESTFSNHAFNCPPHQGFATHFTENYEAIATEYPIFTEIKRLGQITAVVKWLRDHNIAFDTSFFETYTPVAYPTPLSVQLYKDVKHCKHGPIELHGGIGFNLNNQNFSTAENSKVNQFKKEVLAARPAETTFSWELDSADQHSLSAEAVPLLKTRKTGDLRKTFIDLQFPAPGDLPLMLCRFYDSFNDQDKGLGVGWTITPYEIYLTEKVQASADGHTFSTYPLLIVREGNQHWIYRVFRYDGKVWYQREDQQQLLYELSDHTFSLPLKGGGQAVFNALGHLTALVDKQQIKTHYLQSNGRLEAIEHQNGKKIQLHYVGERLVSAVDPKGTLITYGYDDKNQLKEVYGDQNKLYLTYQYDNDLRLTHIIGPDKEILFEGSYDEYNRVSSTKIGEQELKKDYSLVEHTATVTTFSGVEIRSEFDKNYRLIGCTSDKQELWKTAFEKDKHTETSFNHEGEKEWECTYDSQGLLEKVLGPSGEVLRFYYNRLGGLILKEDIDGEKTYFEYDNANRLSLKIEHAQNVVYDAVQKKVSLTAAREHRTRYFYNNAGRLRLLVEGDEMTDFRYDENGVLSEMDLPSKYFIQRELDDQLRVKRLSDKGGFLKEFGYDEQGRIKTETSPAGQIEYHYNENGQLDFMKDRCGHITEFKYDDAGNLEVVKDAEGFVTRYTYS